MESSFHGQLSDKSTSNLIREIAEGHLSGLLRFYREETVKAIFFEQGAPVFSASNLPTEQLEHKLLKNGLVDPDLIEEARRRSLTPEGLGWALVEVGAISQLSMDWSIHELATEIILSVFEWEDGTYTFYEESGVDLGTRLDWPPPECVLAGARRAARNDSIANAGAPPHRLVSPTTLGGPSSFGGLSTLNSVEGFVLSSVMTPTQIGDISSLTGLPEFEARSAVYVLLALGLLQLDAEESADMEIASERLMVGEGPVTDETLMVGEGPVTDETLMVGEGPVTDEMLMVGEGPVTDDTLIARQPPIAGESVIDEDHRVTETQVPDESRMAGEGMIDNEDARVIDTQVTDEYQMASETWFLDQSRIDSEDLTDGDSQIDAGMDAAAADLIASESVMVSETPIADETHLDTDSRIAAETLTGSEDVVDMDSLIDIETLTPSNSPIDHDSHIASGSQIAGDSQIDAGMDVAAADLASDSQIASESQIGDNSPIESESQLDADSQKAIETPVEPGTPPSPGRQESLLPGFDSGRYGAASLEWVLDVVGRKLTFMESANYYEQLGVDRIAPTSRITDAYRQNSERLDSFRSRWPEDQELCRQVETLLAKMEQAYATLSDPEKRSNYDRPPNAVARAPKGTGPVKPADAVPKARPTSDSKPSKPLVPLSGTGFDVALSPRSDVARVRAGQVFDPIAMAEQQYNRGRKHFDRRDFHSAVHLFREAAKLDASQSRYHFYLGVTLSVLSQARQTHKEHTHDRGCHVTCTLGGGLIRNQRIRREAEQHMLRAAELDRLNAEVRLRLALLYKDAGMEKKAQHYFLETLMLDANNLIAQRELGMETRSLPTEFRRIS